MVNRRTVNVARAVVALVSLLVSSQASAQNLTLRENVLLGGVNAWRIVGVGDFDRNGKSDLLWRRADQTGQPRIWFLGDGVFQSSGVLPDPGADWTIAGIADFDYDGRSDLLLTHTSGQASIWLLEGAVVRKKYVLPTMAGRVVAGIGDFDRDSRQDVLWWNQSTGGLQVWTLDGGENLQRAPRGGGLLERITPPSVPAGFNVVGVADFDVDANGHSGKADILARNGSTGELRAYLSETGAWISLANPGTSWGVAGVSDLDGCGRSEILLRTSAGGDALRVLSFYGNGALREDRWLPGGAAWAPLGDRSWALVGIGNHDQERVDLFWRRADLTGGVQMMRLERRFADFSVDPAGSRLKRLAQEQTLWCWAATGQMIMDYLDPKTAPHSQCREASDRASRNCCATTPCTLDTTDPCNFGGGPPFGRFGFSWKTRAVDQGSAGVPHPGDPGLTLKELVTEFHAGRPISIAWGFGTGGHLMVAYGVFYQGGVPMIRIHDPALPCKPGTSGSVTQVPYQDLYIASDHHFHGMDYGIHLDRQAALSMSATSGVTGAGVSATSASTRSAEFPAAPADGADRRVPAPWLP